MRKGKPFSKLLIIPGLIVPVFLFMAANTPKTGLPSFWDPVPHGELAAAIASEMTDEELLSQILMFGWAGGEASPLVTSWVEERSLGSIKVFGWNTDNTYKVAQAISLLQKKAESGRFKIPLFVATDQEGGWIRHVKGRTSETPGNLAIGASALPSDAWYSGYYIGKELRALGINLNFAPTVDLYTDHESTVIGPRSFGEDPETSGILGAAFAAGSLASGVLSTAKHFPGHGDTGADSHGKLPIINISVSTLYNRELVPFTRLIEGGIPAIMSGHLSFPNAIDGGKPATFSRKLLNDILRGQMGFEGLIITDDIMMNGATMYAGSVSRAVIMAIEAGNDIVESSTTPHFSDALWRNTLQQMKDSKAFRSRVTESAERVIRMKLDYFKGENPVPVFPDLDKIDELVPDREGEAFFLSQAVRSVTLFKGSSSLPPTTDTSRVLIASSFSEFLSAGIERYPDADTSGITETLIRKAPSADAIIVCLAGRENLPVIQRLKPWAHKVYVVSILSPVPLRELTWAQNAVAIYSYSPFSFQAVFGALKGDFTPTGILPLKDLN